MVDKKEEENRDDYFVSKPGDMRFLPLSQKSIDEAETFYYGEFREGDDRLKEVKK